MASLVITNSFSAGGTIIASQFNTNFSDISTYINARNSGVTAWDGLTVPSGTFSNGTNQLVLGTTNTTTISATAPAASAVYTIPDVGTTANFLMSTGTQGGSPTLSGNPIFSGTPHVTGTLNVDKTKLQIGGNQAYPIVQIVTGTSTTTYSTVGTNFETTNLSVTITPKFSTSKILLIATGCLFSSNNGTSVFLTIANGTSDLLNGGGTELKIQGSGLSLTVPVTVQAYDSPGTTSAVTYNVRIKGPVNAAFGNDSITQFITASEIAQ